MTKWLVALQFIISLSSESFCKEQRFQNLENRAIESLAFLNVTTLEDIEEVKLQLEVMYDVDRAIRNECKTNYSDKIQNLRVQMADVYARHLQVILKRHGWINISIFGEEADDHACVLVQHSDHDINFQIQCLDKLFDSILKGETNPNHYAFLYDRVAKNSGEKQRYGTQLSREFNKWVLWDHEGSLQQLNERRATVGLSPVEEYLQQFKRLSM